MQRKDLLWVLAYPIYQVIGTFRHEAGHALAAIAFGGSIEEFVFLPTEGYWGYVRWDGPHNLFTTGAPYLLDLLTFLVFFTCCMQLSFHRRWVWLNMVILGIVSPLINSAYNYRQNPGRVNDVTILLRDGNATMLHAYFLLTLSLYIAGLYILFTRAKIHHHQPPVSRAWTAVPLMLGAALLISACGSTLSSSLEPPEQQEDIENGGQAFTFTGRELIKMDGTGDDHDEDLALKMPSGVWIEFGAYSDADGDYDQYRAEVLPILIRILETYETIPRTSTS